MVRRMQSGPFIKIKELPKTQAEILTQTILLLILKLSEAIETIL